ncbi:hypothetical protein FJV00_15205 [Acinetobacter baumannii]|nr:hypothetical protein [Acinetobacter baumannii]TPU04200.1 hypothetical protein FJV00_15205 [Acinetobacter baumannii]
MVAERKRVDRLNLRISTPEGVPLPSYRYKKGDERVYIKKTNFFNVLRFWPVKASWQCGQHAKHNPRAEMCQCSFNDK